MNLKAKTVTDLELLVYCSKNEASIFETKKVENIEHEFLNHFKSILVILLILLESAPQTLSNDIKMNKIRPILIERQQFEKLVHGFLKRTIFIVGKGIYWRVRFILTIGKLF